MHASSIASRGVFGNALVEIRLDLLGMLGKILDGDIFKYEQIYLHDYDSVWDLKPCLQRGFAFYNTDRAHKSLEYRTLVEVYRTGREAARFPSTIHLIFADPWFTDWREPQPIAKCAASLPPSFM